jgi:hypothetical protein
VPYGVHLFDAESPETAALRVFAPAGSYTGVSFTLGLDDACNSGVPSQRRPPLTDSSQLTWPHAIGYLFLRLESRVDVGGAAADAGAAAVPAAIHMGGAPGRLFAPTTTAPGNLVVASTTPAHATLALDMGALFAAAEGDADPSIVMSLFPGDEVRAGEALRERAARGLFVLRP